MPIISIVVPAYNAESTILQTIQSVQQQTFADFELIVVNDGSSDRTLEILNTIADPRLKVFSYENGGVSRARNRGIAQATGQFIAFLDTDDLWSPDKLERQLAALEQSPQAGVAYSWTQFMDEQGEFVHTDTPLFFEGNVYSQLLIHNFLASGSNPLIRKSALDVVGGFDPTLTHGEDWDLYLRLAARWPFVLVPQPQVFYRQTAGSASSKIEVMERDSLIVIERAFATAPPELRSLKSQSLANLYRFLAHLYLTRTAGQQRVALAAQKLKAAIQQYPKTLLERRSQVLLIKLLLLSVLAPRWGDQILSWIRGKRATRIVTNQE